MSSNKLRPQSLKQAQLLASTSDITVFGGAAGSGKSFLGYMSFLKYIHLHNFRGMVIRRTIPMLTKPGAVADAMQGMYREACPNVKYGTKSMKFVFPSGAEVQLGGMEHEKDKFAYQG